MPGYYRMILFLEKKKLCKSTLVKRKCMCISKFQIVNKTGVINCFNSIRLFYMTLIQDFDTICLRRWWVRQQKYIIT